MTELKLSANIKAEAGQRLSADHTLLNIKSLLNIYSMQQGVRFQVEIFGPERSERRVFIISEYIFDKE